MTRDEFGVELFDAVKCCGGLLAIQDQLRCATTDKAMDLKVRQSVAYKLLAEVTAPLSADDQQALCDRYPQLLGTR